MTGQMFSAAFQLISLCIPMSTLGGFPHALWPLGWLLLFFFFFFWPSWEQVEAAVLCVGWSVPARPPGGVPDSEERFLASMEK